MALIVLCSQNNIHIPKPIKRLESRVRNKVMRVAKVCDQIAREDVAYVKRKIPKVHFNQTDEEDEDIEQVEPVIVNVDTDIFDSQ